MNKLKKIFLAKDFDKAISEKEKNKEKAFKNGYNQKPTRVSCVYCRI